MAHPFDETAALIGELLRADAEAVRRGHGGYAGMSEAHRARLRAEAAELRRLARTDREERRAFPDEFRD